MAGDRENIAASKERGEGLIAQKLFEEARGAFEEIRGFAEADPVIFVKLAEISQELGDGEKAIEDYKLAAFAFARLGSITKAVATAKIILTLDPTEAGLLDEVSSIYLDEGPGGSASADTKPGDAPPLEPALKDESPIPGTPLFSSLPRLELIEVLSASNHLKIPSGEVVLSTDDEGRSIFVITSGSADVICKSPEEEEITCATLNEGDFFGEIGYFSGEHRSANVKAKEDMELLELTQMDMRLLIDSHHSIGDVLFDFYKERVLDRLLAVSKIFMHLSPDDRKAVLELVDSQVFIDGMDIVCEGEEGNEMYLIKTGSVEVWTGGEDGKKEVLATLSAGDSFGQLALILETTRNATVTALTPVELIVFSGTVLHDILSGYPAIQNILDKEAAEQVRGRGIERITEKAPIVSHLTIARRPLSPPHIRSRRRPLSIRGITPTSRPACTPLSFLPLPCRRRDP